MNNELLAEACRIEYDEKTDKLYIVFEVKNLLFKQKIKKEWTKDLEFIIVDKQLYESK
jgi:hypothetical protein